MTQVEARVPTARGGRYVQQLCSHWERKLPVETEGDCGVVTLVGAVATMKADAEAIAVSVRGADRQQLDHLKEVIARHIDRFALREAPLRYDWAWV